MSDDCTICHHPPHAGLVCGRPITKDISDNVGFAGPPSYITRTVIDRTCVCGLVDSLAEQFGIDVDDITPYTT